MPNGSAFLDEIAQLVAARRREMATTRSRLQDLTAEIEGLETAARVYRQEHGITGSVEPNDLQGKTQVQALITIARAGNGQFKVNDAKRLMLQAGLIRNPKNAASILYTLINRNDQLFEKVKPGVYRLRHTRPSPSAISAEQTDAVTRTRASQASRSTIQGLSPEVLRKMQGLSDQTLSPEVLRKMQELTRQALPPETVRKIQELSRQTLSPEVL
ncbi:MAG: hypothetical protein WAV28_14725, partial [Sedimentisphaerales bacterium]